jgi:hypothetical protein
MDTDSIYRQSQHILELIEVLGIGTGYTQGGFFSDHLTKSVVENGLGRVTVHPVDAAHFSVTSASVFLHSIKQTEKSLQVTLFA